jgi:hypothetical protein
MAREAEGEVRRKVPGISAQVSTNVWKNHASIESLLALFAA